MLEMKCIKVDPEAKLPVVSTGMSACFDIPCCLYADDIKVNGGPTDPVHEDSKGRYAIVRPGDTMMVPTGLIFKLPITHQMKIIPRSGYAWRNSITVLNSPGTIDCVPKGTFISTENGDIKVEDLYDSKDKIKVISVSESGKYNANYVTHMEIVKDSELLEIVTSDGKNVSIPPTKEVYTKSGWKKIKDVNIGEEIAVF